MGCVEAKIEVGVLCMSIKLAAYGNSCKIDDSWKEGESLIDLLDIRVRLQIKL